VLQLPDKRYLLQSWIKRQMPLTIKMKVKNFSVFHTDIVACFKDGNFLYFKQVHINTDDSTNYAKPVFRPSIVVPMQTIKINI